MTDHDSTSAAPLTGPQSHAMEAAADTSVIDRREAIRRVTAIFGGITLVGGSTLLAACDRASDSARANASSGVGTFTTGDIALLDHVADTILPATSTPGAKAARTGAFMALMVTDTYQPKDAAIFREGIRTIDAECRKETGKPFMIATEAQRLTLIERLDREQKTYTDARDAASRAAREKEDAQKADAVLPDQRKENAPAADANPAPAITADAPAHYFRMMKELTMLGYFTSEIGMTQAQRYIESPGRFDPCVPYTAGEKSWAPHA
jgi:hypothetical protein